MTWIAVVSIIVISLIKIVLTCLPTGAVEWILRKFEIHSKLSDVSATVSCGGKTLEGEDKSQIIHDLNEAVFLERHYIYPGDEQLYLHPENGAAPLVIETKKGKKDVTLFVYSYEDHVDVVKQQKKKVVAYSLLSDSLQQRSMAVTGSL
ncbi:YfmQ family protein [Bacillus sp. YC2]|uniref:YfmQ family protein n=1 Tax=Bacillus sp. YC2 TaxID=2861287 RepID=UPI001CA75404|nr:YfmQ family protein [Bacillus sp. YC2]MBY8914421.1 YfmQ family protein [Bacillus sp. YC2]